jgi:secreted trypsin-like serine protease
MILALLPTVFGGPLIINGEDAGIDDYPAAGALIMQATFTYEEQPHRISIFVCSSTLIAPDVVLLAAHCVDDLYFTTALGSPLDDKVLAWTRQSDLTDWDGSHSLPDWPSDAVTVRGSVAHEDYSLVDLDFGLSENHDVALLFLDEAVETPVAYLPSKDEALQIENGLTVEVVGWGIQTAIDPGELPAEGTYAVKQMGESFIAQLAPYEMQVGLEETDVRQCYGDSGGPTFLGIETTTDDAMRVIGVTSHLYDSSYCANTGAVETRVDYYLDWIDEHMRAACDDGTRVWCDQPGILLPPTTPSPEDAGVEDAGSSGGQEEKGGCGCGGAGASPVPAILAGLLALRRKVGNPLRP